MTERDKIKKEISSRLKKRQETSRFDKAVEKLKKAEQVEAKVLNRLNIVKEKYKEAKKKTIIVANELADIVD